MKIKQQQVLGLKLELLLDDNFHDLSVITGTSSAIASSENWVTYTVFCTESSLLFYHLLIIKNLLRIWPSLQKIQMI